MLCSAVKNYLSNVRTCLPFFYVVDDKNYGTILEEIKQQGVEIVRLSDFCPSPDKFPSIDSLIDYFRTADVDYKSNKCVLVGLGEYLALRGEKETRSILAKLKDTTLGNERVVLLLRCISNQVQDLVNEDIRLKSQGRVYIEPVNSTEISLINVNPAVSIVKNMGIKYLLQTLELGAVGKQTFSSNLNYDKSLIPIGVINDAYDAISYMYKDFSVKRDFGSNEYWNKLYVELEKSEKSFSKLFKKYGFDKNFETGFYKKIAGYEFKNWLFFIALIMQKNAISNSYLKYVVETTHNFEDLKKNVLSAIIDISHTDSNFKIYYAERKQLVSDFPESDIAAFIKSNRVDLTKSLYRLTDNTIIERQEIITLVSKFGYVEEIDSIYPDLAMYLKKYVFNCGKYSEELTKYFDDYKRNKVENKVPAAFVEKVQQFASSLIYTHLDTRDNVIKAISDKEHTHLCWIDAFGVEYLSYVTYLAKKKGLSVSVDIARADLPTITSINKRFFEEWNGAKKTKIEDLDDIKHEEKGGFNYVNNEYPIHLVNELMIVDKVIEQASTELALRESKQFVIVSDHGASRLAVIYKQELYETDTRGEHSGRCCKKFDGCELPFAIEEDEYISLADYGRFKGSRAANVEVHGGASLEEVVVPIIVLKLKNNEEQQIFVIDKDNIYADRKVGTSFRLYISDVNNKNKISIVIENKRYFAKVEDDEHFVFELSDVKKSKKCSAEIFDGDDLIGKIELNDGFDDLF